VSVCVYITTLSQLLRIYGVKRKNINNGFQIRSKEAVAEYFKVRTMVALPETTEENRPQLHPDWASILGHREQGAGMQIGRPR
jgi:hypothetical protein